MYVLEIETKNKLRKIENAKKARIGDRIFCSVLQIMDEDGKWYTICCCLVGEASKRMIVDKINAAIKKKEKSIYIDI